MRKALSLLTLFFSLTGCTARHNWAPPLNQEPRSPDGASETSWTQLQQMEPGQRVAVYLDNGGRMVQRFRGATDTELILDTNGVAREKVVAVATAPEDRLLNGVLIGTGTGAAIGMLIGAGLMAADDFSGSVLAASTIYGVAAGAGFGALWDAGLATPEQPIYVRDHKDAALSFKRWKLTVPPVQLSAWIEERKVELMLKDGTYFRGKVTGGDGQHIRLQVADSSLKNQKGQRIELSVDQISTVAYRELMGGNRGAAGWGGGLTGFFSGLLAGAALDQDSARGLAIGTLVGTVFGTGAGIGLAEYRNRRDITLIVK